MDKIQGFEPTLSVQDVMEPSANGRLHWDADCSLGLYFCVLRGLHTAEPARGKGETVCIGGEMIGVVRFLSPTGA